MTLPHRATLLKNGSEARRTRWEGEDSLSNTKVGTGGAVQRPQTGVFREFRGDVDFIYTVIS